MADYVLAPGATTLGEMGPPLARQVPQRAPDYQMAPGDISLGYVGATPSMLKMVVDPREASGILENLEAGLKASAVGLQVRGKLPDVVPKAREEQTWYEAAARSVGGFAGDLPYMGVGAALGGAAGHAAGSVAGPFGSGIGRRFGAGYGAFALPAGIRAYYMESLTHGEIRDSADFWNRFPDLFEAAHHEGKLGLLLAFAPSAAGTAMLARSGLSTGKAARAGFAGVEAAGLTAAEQTAARAVLATTQTRAAQLAAEYAAFAGGPALLEARLPEWHEFVDAAVFLAGYKGATKAAGKLKQVYEDTGVLPLTTLSDARVDPTILLDIDARAPRERLADQRTVQRAVELSAAEEVSAAARTPRQAALLAEGPARLEPDASGVLKRAMGVLEKPVESRTLEERTFVERIVREDPLAESTTLSPQAREAVHTQMVAELQRLGRKDIAVELADRVLDGRADAVYDRSVITLALDTPPAQRLGVLNHEAIHALADLGVFTKGEWNALQRAASRWIDQKDLRGDGFSTRERYADDLARGRLTEENVREEAIADANRALSEGRVRDPRGLLEKTMGKIHAFLEALGNALRGNGFRTGVDVLREVQAGTIGARPGEAPAVASGPMFSKRYSSRPDEIPNAYRPLLDRETQGHAFPLGIDQVRIKDLIKNPAGTIPDTKAENYINFKYVKGPDALKSLYAAISEQFTKEIETERQSPTSWEKTFAQARDLINADGSVNTQTLRQAVSSVVLSAASHDVMKSAERLIENNTRELQAVHESNMMMLVAAYKHDQGVGADSARALVLRRAMNESAATAEQLMQTEQFRANAGGVLGFGTSAVDPVSLARMISMLKDRPPRKVAEAVTKMHQATKYEMVIEAWKAGLVSGPFTHATNIVGNGLFAFTRPIINAMGAIGGALTGREVGFEPGQRASVMEPVYQLVAMVAGVKQGLIDAGKVLSEGDLSGKAEQYREAIPGLAGRIIRTPFRALSAEDAFFSSLMRRSEMTSRAVRLAVAEGRPLESRELAETVNGLLDGTHPLATKFAEEVEASVKRFTFNEPLGPRGQAITNMVRSLNLQFIVPFIRTPLNILEEMLRVSPFSPAVKAWRDDVSAGGIRRDRALAELTMGTTIAAYVAMTALNGNDDGEKIISGAGSPDAGKRRGAQAAGWQPYSVRIGDTWYNYQRIQPLGTLMGMAADAAEVYDFFTEEESDKVYKMIATAFANAVTNQTFLQGVTSLARALDEPQRFGPKVVQQFAASWVPGIVGQHTANLDPYVREVNSVIEAVQARIPGYREDLLPKLDAYGQPIETKERLAYMLPVTETQVSPDKVRMETERLGISIAPPPKRLQVGRGTGKFGEVELSPEQRHDYTRVSGEFAHNLLSQVVHQPSWDVMPDIIKRKVYQRVFVAAHRMGAMAALPPEQRAGILFEAAQQLQEALQQ